MNKHTPGPWRVVNGHYPCMSEIQGPSFKISIVMSAADLSLDESMRREADARLIAAAPELLDALRPFAALLQSHHAQMEDARAIFGINADIISVGDLRAAQAALAKAEAR